MERRPHMLNKLFATDDSRPVALLRLVLGVVFFAHGAQEMLGWFGGFGVSGTVGYMNSMLHIPKPLALLATCAEFFGSPGRIRGFLTRSAALGIAKTTPLTIWTSHSSFG